MTGAKTLPLPDKRRLIGTWRRFGEFGPVYEVLAFGRELNDGDWMMRVRVLETEEEVEYKLSDLEDDPQEI